MTTVDSGAADLQRYRRPARRVGRRRAVGDDEPAGQPQLADRGDVQRPSPSTLEQAATDPRVKVVRLGGAGRGFSSGAGISDEDQAQKSVDGPDIGSRRGQRRRAVDREPATAGGRRRAGAVRRRRCLAGVGVRRRIGFGEGVFHAGLHQDRADARRRRVGVDRRGGRSYPRHADGADGRADHAPTRHTSGVWSPPCIPPRNSTPRWTR